MSWRGSLEGVSLRADEDVIGEGLEDEIEVLMTEINPTVVNQFICENHLEGKNRRRANQLRKLKT